MVQKAAKCTAQQGRAAVITGPRLRLLLGQRVKIGPTLLKHCGRKAQQGLISCCRPPARLLLRLLGKAARRRTVDMPEACSITSLAMSWD